MRPSPTAIGVPRHHQHDIAHSSRHAPDRTEPKLLHHRSLGHLAGCHSHSISQHSQSSRAHLPERPVTTKTQPPCLDVAGRAFPSHPIVTRSAKRPHSAVRTAREASASTTRLGNRRRANSRAGREAIICSGRAGSGFRAVAKFAVTPGGLAGLGCEQSPHAGVPLLDANPPRHPPPRPL